jgi:hypothetical protein
MKRLRTDNHSLDNILAALFSLVVLPETAAIQSIRTIIPN